MTVGMVLGGGAAKGSFQLGCLSLLYSRGVRPDIVVGTSVGAINAIKLAEGEQAGDQLHGLAGLEAIWHSLLTNADMYVPADWLFDSAISEDVRAVILGEAEASDIVPNFDSDSTVLGFDPRMLIWAVSDGADILEAAGVMLQKAESIYRLDPIERLLHAQVDLARVGAWAAGGGRVLLAVVALESGALRYVTESGAVLERDLRPAVDRSVVPESCQQAWTNVQAAANELRDAEQEAAEATNAAQRAAAGRHAAQARRDLQQASETYRACFDQAVEDGRASPLHVDVRDGVLASASAPPAFPPVLMGGEHYVDGGVRSIVPTEAAIEAGADRLYIVGCSPPESQAYEAQAWKLPAIASRSIDLLETENTHEGLSVNAATNGSVRECYVMTPDWIVHDGAVVDPGLIQINVDYGWMRAADVLDKAASGSARERSATDIAKLRVDIWREECAVAGQQDPTRPATKPSAPQPQRQAVVNAKKANLDALLTAREEAGGTLPSGIRFWTTHPERHPWSLQPGTGDGAQPDDGAVVPVAVVPGGTADVAIPMLNLGTTTWTPGAYALAADLVADGWTVPATVPLSAPVDFGRAATFRFQIVAPSTPTSVTLSWHMHHDGQPFGSPAGPFSIAARDDAACAQLAADIAKLRSEVQALEQERNDLDPSDPGYHRLVKLLSDHIDLDNSKIADKQHQQAEQGCA